jgi:hypothetical protein
VSSVKICDFCQLSLLSGIKVLEDLRRNILTCYCEVSLVMWRRCPVMQQCEYIGSYSIDDAGRVHHYCVCDNGHRETFSMVTRLLSMDFCWFVELVHVGRLREKVLLEESPVGHVSCYSGQWRQLSGLVNGTLVTDYTLRCCSGIQVDW